MGDYPLVLHAKLAAIFCNGTSSDFLRTSLALWFFQMCMILGVSTSEFKSFYKWCTSSPTFKSHANCWEIPQPVFQVWCFDPLVGKKKKIKEGRDG